MEIKVDNKALLETLDRLPDAIRVKAARAALRKATTVVKKQSEENVGSIVSNEATGTLQKSIQVFKLKDPKRRIRYGVRIKPKTFNTTKTVDGKPVRVGLYASVLEYGKKDQPPRSWLRSAAAQKTQEAFQTFAQALRNGIDRAVSAAKNKESVTDE